MLIVHEVPSMDWPDLAAGFRDLTMEQTQTYAEAAAARIGAKTLYLAIEQASTSVAVACLRVKSVPGLDRGIAWAASGPMLDRKSGGSADTEAVLQALRDYVCGRLGHILRLRFPVTLTRDPAKNTAHTAKLGFYPTSRAAVYRTVMIDLTQDEDTLMRALHQKWRNALRSALKKGMQIDRGAFGNPTTRNRFFALYNIVQQAKGFTPDISPEFYEHLKGPDFAHEVLIARQGKTDLAAMTLGRAGTSLVYLFGATVDAGRQLNAGYALMWQAILLGRAMGSATFDLGGIDETANPDVTRFKRRTGGVEIAAAGPFETLPRGPLPRLILAADAVRTRLKR